MPAGFHTKPQLLPCKLLLKVHEARCCRRQTPRIIVFLL
jgi:hypothetical protein